ncbi:MAG TPA: PEP-CTERM sorting domain-containing protein [Candidatus Sulfotelmatobacter sp.]|nr:PEP-CTERM sorting domain-containing protein [Candidatus Sulfotelmatobacter sp.]
MKFGLVLFALIALAVAVPAAHADTVAYTDPSGAGDQAFTGNLALTFTVDSPITVTSLGVFNASGSGLITGTLQVVIFNTATNTEVTPVVTFGPGTTYVTGGAGFDVFQSISPVVLTPGTYEVDAVGFSTSDPNGNLNMGSVGPALNNGGGVLTFTGAAYNFSTGLNEALTCGGCKPLPPETMQFDAGTFTFEGAVVTTPEPASLSLFATGLLGLAVLLRRKRSA